MYRCAWIMIRRIQNNVNCLRSWSVVIEGWGCVSWRRQRRRSWSEIRRLWNNSFDASVAAPIILFIRSRSVVIRQITKVVHLDSRRDVLKLEQHFLEFFFSTDGMKCMDMRDEVGPVAALISGRNRQSGLSGILQSVPLLRKKIELNV